jgi:hypothetical protein
MSTRQIHLSVPALLLFMCCFGGGCQQMRQLGGFSERLVDVITGKTPKAAALKMEDPYFPDERRQGINQLVDRSFGKGPIYTARYRQIAQYDPDYLVRATALRALNRARDQGATPLFIRALDDPNDAVRLEGAKALVNLPDEHAQQSLLRLVNNPNENRDVRIAAADALRHYKSLDVARTLIGQLSSREFGLAWQSRRSLRNLTGKDLHYDESAWLGYVTGPEKPFG